MQTAFIFPIRFFLLGAFLFTTFLILGKYPFLTLPLIGDEWYYANPRVVNDLFHWPSYSFGHPPGWHLINAIAYTIFSYSPFVAHGVGLATSVFSILLLWREAMLAWRPPVAFVVISAILAQSCFIEESSLNYPVILSTTTGMVALFRLYRQEYFAWALWVTLAVSLRESSIVYVIAGLLMDRRWRTMKASVIPLGFFIAFYVWHYIYDGSVMLNPQMSILKKQTGEIFVFSFQHFADFYIYSLYPSLGMAWPLFPSALGFYLWRVRYAKLPSIFLGLTIVFMLDSAFFAFYPDRAIRNTSNSAIALLISSGILLHASYFSSRFAARFFSISLLIFSGIVLIWVFRETRNPHSFLMLSKEEAEMYAEVDSTLRTYSGQEIVATNPMSIQLSESYLGWVKYEHKIRWYGGAPGLTKVGDPQVVLVPGGKSENFAVGDLRKLVSDTSKYRLEHRFISKLGNFELGLYVRRN